MAFALPSQHFGYTVHLFRGHYFLCFAPSNSTVTSSWPTPSLLVCPTKLCPQWADVRIKGTKAVESLIWTQKKCPYLCGPKASVTGL